MLRVGYTPAMDSLLIANPESAISRTDWISITPTISIAVGEDGVISETRLCRVAANLGFDGEPENAIKRVMDAAEEPNRNNPEWWKYHDRLAIFLSGADPLSKQVVREIGMKQTRLIGERFAPMFRRDQETAAGIGTDFM